MSTFLCKNGVRKEYFLTPTFIIEPKTICLQGFILVLQAISFIDHLTRKEERRYLPANQNEKKWSNPS